jgi:hypothetical protein
MDNMKPGAIAMLAGGALLLVASFLDWQSFGPFGFNAWDRGLTGLFLLVISGIAIAVPAISTFAPQVSLPSDILGMSPVRVATLLGLSAFLLSFCLLFQIEGFAIGSILAVVASAAIVVGGYLDENQGSSEATRTI